MVFWPNKNWEENMSKFLYIKNTGNGIGPICLKLIGWLKKQICTVSIPTFQYESMYYETATDINLLWLKTMKFSQGEFYILCINAYGNFQNGWKSLEYFNL